MNTVWVLIAVVSNGHFGNYVVPTLEFSSEQKCKVAIVDFIKDTEGKHGNASSMRCVKIEK
jgi:hypothetical protein